MVLSVLVAVGSRLTAAFVAPVLPVAFARPGPPPLARLLWAASALWVIGMALVLRHRRRATCSWVQERRGGPMLCWVEAITAVLSLAASRLYAGSNDDLVRAARVCFSGLLLLLIFGHVAAYALLRYVPRRKEVAVWSALAGTVALEIWRDH
jgi:hypothetical protein